jgi:hypothetical protein
MKSASLFLVSALLSLSFSCGGGDGGKGTPDDNSTATVLRTMNSVLPTALEQGGALPTTTLRALPPSPRDGSYNNSINVQGIPCSGGGTVDVWGSANVNWSGASPVHVTGDLNLTFRFGNCKAVGKDDVTYTIVGPLDYSGTVTLDITPRAAGSEPSIVGSSNKQITSSEFQIEGGSIDFSNCAVDLTDDSSWNITGSNTTFTGSFSGTICGVSVSASYTYP